MIRREFLASLAAPLTRRTAENRYAPFDKLMTGFLAEHGVPGASVAVSHDHRVAYAKGFGFADVEAKAPVETRSLFRIASISKPITAVAVLQLVDAGKIDLEQPILDFVHIRPAQRLDPRWYLVTVRHCLQHTGGWDRSITPDPIAIPWQIAKALGTKPPVPLEDVIRYTMMQPLDHDPGTKFAYSNVGYLLLGRAIAEASGRHYEEYVRKEVLAPLGISDMELGRALPEHRAKSEVSYYDAKQAEGSCLYPPRVNERVPFPDGAGNVEAYEAHGGWIASASSLVKFALAFDLPPFCPILSRRAIRTMFAPPRSLPGTTDDAWYGCGWIVRRAGLNALNTFHNGYISGSSTLLVRRHDGWNWAVLFNSERSKNGKTLSNLIDPLMHLAVNEVIAAG
ncbi:MAG: serine hydrolase domain-containing protein [Gemmataceae bacterium]